MHTRIRTYAVTAGLFLAFILFTLVVRNVDVRPVGPEGSSVGLATVNRLVSDRVGVTLFWYNLTDWLGLVAILVACGFAALGLYQLVTRGSLKRVDPDVLLLGAFYLAVIGCYVLFETLVVNYRPVLLHGSLEASYPSSHVVVVVCIMVTAMTQFRRRVRNGRLLRALNLFCVLVVAVTVLGRLVSGVHWLTDILGGLILSAALVALYRAVTARV
ncbi:MAG: phosphoesterase PA-phosphatase [Spirochaetae bacterium HGW-Spirochaetae-3]|jgi:undecaprenyl-diphosphatase|nr:MAG: phosphoesterase PA-phosphatase [Spirochaetae bacterium HGW-Spirochaetae-3]